jgi:hypothetical protein
MVKVAVFLPPPILDATTTEEDAGTEEQLAARAKDLLQKAPEAASVATVPKEVVAAAHVPQPKKQWPKKKFGDRKRRRSEEGTQGGHGGQDSSKKRDTPWAGPACAGPTSSLGRQPPPASSPATGWKTRTPSAAQRRRRWDAGTHHRPANGLALPSGHGGLVHPGTTPVQGHPE